MAEGTEPIRQDIDDIRDSMTETLGQIESRVRGSVDSTVQNVREAFDLQKQVGERPWLSLGLAMAAGYLLGSMGGDEPPAQQYGRPGQPMRYYPEHGFRADMPAPGYGQGTSPQAYSPSSSSPSANPSDSTPTYSSATPGTPSYPSYNAAAGFSYDAERNRSNGIGNQVNNTMSRIAAPVGDELSAIAMAAVRSAMRMLRESLQESIPQFNTEYQHVRSERGDAYGMASTEQPKPSETDSSYERSLGASYGSPVGSTNPSSTYESQAASSGPETADYDRSRSSTTSGRSDL